MPIGSCKFNFNFFINKDKVAVKKNKDQIQ